MIVPPGFGTIAPYLYIKDTSEYVQFLLAAFDCKEVGRTLRPDGQIAHCQVRFGSATIMLSEAQGSYEPTKSAFYVFVDDVDSAVQRAIESGAKLEMDVMDMPYGDRQGGVTDLAGNIWWIAQRLSSESYY